MDLEPGHALLEERGRLKIEKSELLYSFFQRQSSGISKLKSDWVSLTLNSGQPKDEQFRIFDTIDETLRRLDIERRNYQHHFTQIDNRLSVIEDKLNQQ